MHALIPVKGLDLAKSRLQHVLTGSERRALASCLLDDTLATLSAIPWIQRVLVVTSNEEVARRAEHAGAVAVAEPPFEPDPSNPHGPLNAALEAGRHWAMNDGASALTSVPADLPLLPALDSEGLRRDLDRAGQGDATADRPFVGLHTDDQHDGTNLLIQRPSNAIPFRYGIGSFRRHREEALQRGARVIELNDPVFRWDLDHPEAPAEWAVILRRDDATRALYHQARERGTALRFLERTDWGAPLRHPSASA